MSTTHQSRRGRVFPQSTSRVAVRGRDQPRAASGQPLLRLKLTAAELGLDPILAGLILRASDFLDTACWVYNETRGTTEIHVNTKLCLELPKDELQALLLHELYHHVGYSQRHHQFPQQSLEKHAIVNLALDISLERVLSDGHFGDALARLNDRLLVKTLPESGPIPPDQSRCLLVHSRPPLQRMPELYQRIHRHLWREGVYPQPEEVYQQIQPLFDGDGGGADGFGAPIIIQGSYGPESLLPRQLPGNTSETTRLAHVLPERCREVMAESAAADVSSWALYSDLRPAHIRAADVDASAVTDLRAWLLQQEQQSDLLSECFTEVVGDMVDDIVRLPYLLRPTRAELVRMAIGWPKVHYTNRTWCGWRPLHVYIDVSGSMELWLPSVMAVLDGVQELLPAELFLFDAEVRPHPLDVALSGEMFTGGGTDFNNVFAHAMEQGVSDCLVLTDGESEVREDIQRQSAQMGLRARAVIFGGGYAELQPWWSQVYRWPTEPGGVYASSRRSRRLGAPNSIQDLLDAQPF